MSVFGVPLLYGERGDQFGLSVNGDKHILIAKLRIALLRNCEPLFLLLAERPNLIDLDQPRMKAYRVLIQKPGDVLISV